MPARSARKRPPIRLLIYCPTVTFRLALAPTIRSMHRIVPINLIVAPRSGCATRIRRSGLLPRCLHRIHSHCRTSRARRSATLMSVPVSTIPSILPIAPIGLMAAARADSAQDSGFPAEMASGSAQCCEKVIARNARRCSQISPRLSRRPTCRCFSMVGGNR